MAETTCEGEEGEKMRTEQGGGRGEGGRDE